MKKTAAILILSAFVSASAFAYYANPKEEEKAHRIEMKKIKDAQREARRAEKTAEKKAPKEPTFWDREGARSGLSQTGNGIGSFVKNLNPVPFFKQQNEAYKARKAQSGVSGVTVKQ